MDTVAGDNVDIVLKNPYHWREVKSDSVDVLISGQAFEHIEFFWITMMEIARVLKPGGLCCILAPSGGYEHRYPVDCYRFYPDGFTALARYVQMEVVEVATQWEPDPRYTEESNAWRDSMLVCRKGSLSTIDAWRQRLWRRLLHKLSIRHL
jgi:SAM-dependent methyltransferase